MKPMGEEERHQNVADVLGELRLLVYALDAKPGRLLRLRCVTCEREDGGEPCVVLDVSEGRYPLIAMTNGLLVLVLPFDLLAFRSHLLHEIRAEWDRYFLVYKPVRVQRWEREERNYVYIGGSKKCVG